MASAYERDVEGSTVAGIRWILFWWVLVGVGIVVALDVYYFRLNVWRWVLVAGVSVEAAILLLSTDYHFVAT